MEENDEGVMLGQQKTIKNDLSQTSDTLTSAKVNNKIKYSV